MSEDTVTIPQSMYDEFMRSSSILEKIYQAIEMEAINGGMDWAKNADNPLSVEMGVNRKLQEWSIQFSELKKDYDQLKAQTSEVKPT